jgi:hypothetical protein
MKTLIYQVYVGKRSAVHDLCVNSVKDYSECIGSDYICQTQPLLRIKPNPFTSNRSENSWKQHGGFLPIYEKENVFNHIYDYDRVCVIDNDIWIRPGTPNIFNEIKDEDIAAQFERELPADPSYRKRIKLYSEQQLEPLKQYDWDWNENGGNFFNSGVVIYNSSIKDILKGQKAKEFMDRVDFQDFIDGKGFWKWQTDQIMLNYWAKKENLKVKHLDWKWNALYNPFFGGVDKDRAKEAHFVHFFQSGRLAQYARDTKDLLELVK